MTRLAALATALFLASPALAGSFSFDLPNLTFPEGGVTVSTSGCPTVDAQICQAPVRR
jgi:hypothetical protein